MVLINSQNIEELVFFNREIQDEMPEFKEIFEQWALGIRSPLFKAVANKAKLELLSAISTQHVAILEKHLKEKVLIAHINYRLTDNYCYSKDDLECFLLDYDGFDDNLSISRCQDRCFV